jgi:hypothetical protein
MAFNLIYLGTDVTFNPSPSQDYPFGETLSIIASLIYGTQTVQKKGSLDKAELVLNECVTVIKGPDTLGTQVYNRIACGVLAILEAYTRGERHFNIMGFSRGGCIAILTLHEICRLKECFQVSSMDASRFSASQCSGTQNALLKERERLKCLIAQIANSEKKFADVTVSACTIDPVPGGNFHGLPSGWRDVRFYEVPSNVKEYEQYLSVHENTRGFKPVVPSIGNPKHTSSKFVPIYGHHGTSSGNPKDQSLNPIPNEGETQGKTTVHAQELMLHKLIEFLKRNGCVFKTDKVDIDAGYPLHKDILNSIYPSLNAAVTSRHFQQVYLALYQEMARNRAAYEYFRNTHYPYLGYEESFLEVVGLRRKDRRVHFQSHENDSYLNEVMPWVDEKKFVNDDHVQLHVDELLGLNKESSVFELVNNLLTYFGSELGLESENPITALMSSPKGLNLVFDSLMKALVRMEAQYLREELDDEEQRTLLLKKIKEMFQMFIINPQNVALFDNVSKGQISKFLVSTLDKKAKRFGIKTSLLIKELVLLAQEKSESVNPTKDITKWINHHKRLEEFKANVLDLSERIVDINHQEIRKKINEEQKKLFEAASAYVAQTNCNLQFMLRGDDQVIYNQFAQLGLSLKEHQDPHEKACFELITKKLIPLTQNYLKHLNQRASGYVKTAAHLNPKDPLPQFSGKKADVARYKKIVKKHEIARKLLASLNFSTQHPLPSDSIKAFQALLNAAKSDLKSHRSPSWQRYLKQSLLFLAVLITGVIPGMVTLLAYSASRKKSPLFFMQSQGHQFEKECAWRMRRLP